MTKWNSAVRPGAMSPIMRRRHDARFRASTGYRWSAVAENVAYNGRRSEDGVLVVQKAMYNEKPSNDGHRKNILSETYVHVGIDVISDSVHDKVWLVTDFGKP